MDAETFRTLGQTVQGIVLCGYAAGLVGLYVLAYAGIRTVAAFWRPLS